MKKNGSAFSRFDKIPTFRFRLTTTSKLEKQTKERILTVDMS